MARTDQPLVKAEHIVKHFPIRGGVFLRQVDSVKAVNDVSLEIREGETYGLVGESGCGKSTLGSVLLGLEQPTSGRVLFDGVDLTACSRQKRRELRRQIQVVFQDPYESLNPRMTVGEIVSEGLRIQGGCSAQERRERVLQILEQVGLSKEHYGRYPHEFSGGQRQRIGIARALIVNPRFDRQPALYRVRRAGFRAGCFRTGPDHQSAARFAAQAWLCIFVHRPWPERRQISQRAYRRDVSGAACGGGRFGRAV